MSPTAEELEFLNMSSSQSESIVGAPPHVNQAAVSLCHGHFPLTDFPFVRKLQNI